MKLKDWLTQAFDFELWADRLWLGKYPEMPEPKHAEELLGHILWALETWLSRVDTEFQVQEQPFESRLEAACQGWSDMIANRDLDDVVSYQNTQGREFNRQLGAIALHVINHGTYHRGQLRGLAAEQGFLEFPETDLNIYFIQNDLFGE